MHPLVDPAVLHEHLHDPGWLVVDTRHDLSNPGYGPRVYAEGHVPGASFLHLDADLSGPTQGSDGRFRGRHPLPDRAVFAARLAGLGLGPRTTLVAYDDAEGMYASRLWWLALWVGHERAAVLDGGLRAWRAAGYPLDSAPPPARARVPADPRPPLVHTIDADTLAAELGTQRYRIVDARAAERWRGDVEPLDARAGHIPGARNRPFRMNVDEAGRFHDPADLREAFVAAIGDVPCERVVHQCGSGVTACHNLLAMHLAGMPGSLLYPGSWSEWSADPRRPAATGDEP